MAQWLLNVIKPYIDPGQCGLKGLSITHYLIRLLHFVHSTLDTRNPQAVIAACIDLGKAFNRVDHQIVIQDLYDMKTPSWLLSILISYLSNRSMVMTYEGVMSSQKLLPAGTPQGAFLGGLIFIIKYNGAMLRPSIPRPITGPITKSKSLAVKYIDDGTVAVSVDLKSCLIQAPELPCPLTFSQRTGHCLPSQNNLLQYYLEDTEVFTEMNNMVINKPKTFAMKFNKSRNWDFPVHLSFSDGSEVKVASEHKLLGVIITDDMKWDQNTDYICSKARQRLWVLRRLAKHNFNQWQLFDVYQKEIRSILEMCVPVWHSSLTKVLSNRIENIQKLAFKLILRDRYQTYKNACKILQTETLKNRRTSICTNFALKNFKSEYSLFNAVDPQVQPTRRKRKVVEYKCNTNRYYRSSLPYLSRLINAV